MYSTHNARAMPNRGRVLDAIVGTIGDDFGGECAPQTLQIKKEICNSNE
jgi:hypothetical protein